MTCSAQELTLVRSLDVASPADSQFVGVLEVAGAPWLFFAFEAGLGLAIRRAPLPGRGSCPDFQDLGENCRMPRLSRHSRISRPGDGAAARRLGAVCDE